MRILNNGEVLAVSAGISLECYFVIPTASLAGATYLNLVGNLMGFSLQTKNFSTKVASLYFAFFGAMLGGTIAYDLCHEGVL